LLVGPFPDIMGSNKIELLMVRESMLLEEMTMQDFEKGLEHTQTVVIPVGSLEAHGSHLPLATDTLEAYALAKRVAERISVFVAPPVSYGVLRSTRDHPGSVGISPGTLRSIIYDIAYSLHRQGCRRFLILSGHAGSTHVAALKEVAEVLLDRLDGIAVAVLSILDLTPAAVSSWIETKNDAHAGEVETSVMMCIHPNLVQGTSKAEFPVFPDPIMVRNRRKYWPGAVWGDPARAQEEKGQKLIDVGVEKICDVIRHMEALPE
jgi:creatinine amidohydrolase